MSYKESLGYKCFVVACVLLEVGLYSVPVLGWPSLVYIFREEKFFVELCGFVDESNGFNSTGGNHTYMYLGCPGERECSSQEEMLNLIYTTALLSLVAMTPLGYVYDHFGTTVIRIICMILNVGGAVLMAFAQRGSEWLLFPGAAFHLLGGNMYTVTGMQMTQLFPSRKNTLGTLMSGVCGMSTFTFVLVKIAYDNHISHKASLLCLAGVSFVISTVTTIVLPPREKTGSDIDKEKLQKELDYVPSSLADHNKHTIDRNGPVFVVALTGKNHEEKRASGINHGVADNAKTGETNGKRNEITEKGEGSTIIGDLARQNSTVQLLSKDSFASLEAVAVSTPADKTGHTKTFGDILRSPIFWMTEIWFVCNVLLGVAYFGGFNAMVVFRNTGESHRTISLYTDVFGYLQLTGGIPLALLTGFLIERSSRKQSSDAKEAEPKAFLFSFLVTSTAGLLVWVSCVIPVLEMQFTAMAFHCILGTFTYATHIAFIAFAFPYEHFGKAFGIQRLIATMVTGLQYPMFTWLKDGLKGDPFYFSLMLVGVALLSFSLPLYVFVRERKMKATT